MLPALASASATCRQSLRLPARVGDGAGDRPRRCSRCPVPASAPAIRRQSLRLPVRVGDERAAGDLVSAACSCCPVLASASATGARASRLQTGSVMERATVLGLPGSRPGALILPHPGQASATRASASACWSGSVMERATVLGLPGDRPGALILPHPGQRLRHLRQGLRLLARIGDGGGQGFGADGLAQRGPHGGQSDWDIGIAVGEQVALAGQAQCAVSSGASWAA